MKVLIGHDWSTHAEAAIADLERAGLPMDTEARVLSVVERQLHPAADGAAEEICNRLQRRFRHWSVQSETAMGHAAETILDRSREWPADLIVVGTHGRSPIGRLVLGSVSATVARDARCSVRIARSPQPPREAAIRLLIGHDGSPQAEAAVNEVCARSWPAGTEARVMTVIEALIASRADQLAGIADTVHEINAEEHGWLQYLTNESEQRLASAGLIASSVVMDGDPKETLLTEARRWTADSIFVGARGHGFVERFLLGGVSTAVVAHAPSTVEVVRMAGRQD